MTDDQAAKWKENNIKGNKITHAQRYMVANLHAEVFNHPVEMPCTCSPSEWRRLINDIEDLYQAYLADHANT